jgi:hypothetical protein
MRGFKLLKTDRLINFILRDLATLPYMGKVWTLNTIFGNIFCGQFVLFMRHSSLSSFLHIRIHMDVLILSHFWGNLERY